MSSRGPSLHWKNGRRHVSSVCTLSSVCSQTPVGVATGSAGGTLTAISLAACYRAGRGVKGFRIPSGWSGVVTVLKLSRR
jgi:hypothetical protein